MKSEPLMFFRFYLKKNNNTGLPGVVPVFRPFAIRKEDGKNYETFEGCSGGTLAYAGALHRDQYPRIPQGMAAIWRVRLRFVPHQPASTTVFFTDTYL